MAFVSSSTPGGSTGNESTNTNLDFTSSIQKHLSDQRTTDAVIPSGALYVAVEPIFAGEPIKVNGKFYELGTRFYAEVKMDWVEKKVEYCPVVNIESGGYEYTFTVGYPSSNIIDLNTI